MYIENNNLIIEDDDQCITCSKLNKGVACPLIQALAQGVVFIEDSLNVSNCGFYEKIRKTFKISCSFRQIILQH